MDIAVPGAVRERRIASDPWQQGWITFPQPTGGVHLRSANSPWSVTPSLCVDSPAARTNSIRLVAHAKSTELDENRKEDYSRAVVLSHWFVVLNADPHAFGRKLGGADESHGAPFLKARLG